MPKNALEIDDISGLLCELCNKELPVLFYKNEELVKRMADHTMTPFLKDLKTDLFNNEQYLKYLRVSYEWFVRLNMDPIHMETGENMQIASCIVSNMSYPPGIS